MVKTLSVEKVIPCRLSSLQLPIPSKYIKFGVASPLFHPFSLQLRKGGEYNIAFAMRGLDWSGDKDNNYIAEATYKKKRNILYMWLAVDDGSYYYWGRFYRSGTMLLSLLFVKKDLRWEITQAPREVLIEKFVMPE